MKIKPVLFSGYLLGLFVFLSACNEETQIPQSDSRPKNGPGTEEPQEVVDDSEPTPDDEAPAIERVFIREAEEPSDIPTPSPAREEPSSEGEHSVEAAPEDFPNPLPLSFEEWRERSAQYETYLQETYGVRVEVSHTQSPFFLMPVTREVQFVQEKEEALPLSFYADLEKYLEHLRWGSDWTEDLDAPLKMAEMEAVLSEFWTSHLMGEISMKIQTLRSQGVLFFGEDFRTQPSGLRSLNLLQLERRTLEGPGLEGLRQNLTSFQETYSLLREKSRWVKIQASDAEFIRGIHKSFSELSAWESEAEDVEDLMRIWARASLKKVAHAIETPADLKAAEITAQLPHPARVLELADAVRETERRLQNLQLLWNYLLLVLPREERSNFQRPSSASWWPPVRPDSTPSPTPSLD
jgi:hypothetical protein